MRHGVAGRAKNGETLRVNIPYGSMRRSTIDRQTRATCFWLGECEPEWVACVHEGTRMDQLSGKTPATMTFIVRFWREWTGAEARWRGRIEHMQSGRRADFLGVEGLLGFLERFGIGATEPPVRSADGATSPAQEAAHDWSR